MKKLEIFSTIGFVMAAAFWLLESFIHYYIFQEAQFEIIPSDSNELWMRIVIVLMIFLFGVFADFFVARIMHKQLEVAHNYHELIFTSRNILDNLIIQMNVFKTEATNCEEFDREIIHYYDNSMKEASDLIATLSKIESMSQDTK